MHVQRLQLLLALLLDEAVRDSGARRAARARGQVLDDAEDVDADSIPGSNSTYEFIGADATRSELLFSLHPRLRVCVPLLPSAERCEH